MFLFQGVGIEGVLLYTCFRGWNREGSTVVIRCGLWPVFSEKIANKTISVIVHSV